MDPKQVSPERPRVLLSVALSLDGYLDAAGPERLVLSSSEDQDAVDSLRACADAILIGGGTARRDDPQLLVRAPERRLARTLGGKPPSPLRVVLSRSGQLPRTLRLFEASDTPVLLYVGNGRDKQRSSAYPPHVTICRLRPLSLRSVLADLARRGIQRVLIEGGETLSSICVRQGLLDELRVSLSPVVVGRRGCPRLGGRLALDDPLWPGFALAGVTKLGYTVAVHYTRVLDNGRADTSAFLPRDDAGRLAEAVALARRCRPVSTAYSVGAVLVSASGELLATGFSRDVDPHVHAEESAIRRALAAGCSLQGAVLFSSMEPCGERLSGRTPCARHIIESGIARVVYALAEPERFVRGAGDQILRRAGVAVSTVPELAPYALEPNRHLVAETGDARAAKHT